MRGEAVCLRCIAMGRLDEILTGDDGRIPGALVGLRDIFMSVDEPRSILVWLDRSPGVALLHIW
ncbi:MAG TPA: hypothetical protein VM942_02825 [Acidimicrobiales bacterium]|nr:hypothetical protein [Acidimicrobiales bacterium]